MKSIDFHIDFSWVKDHWPIEPKLKFSLSFASYHNNNKFEMLVYGDDYEIKHVRIRTDLQSIQAVEDFIAAKRQQIQTSLETFSGLVCDRPVKFGALAGGNLAIVSYGEDNDAPLEFSESETAIKKFDYTSFAKALSMQFPGMEPYVFYLKMASDIRLPLDYRWLNYYRILETRFNQSGAGLDRSSEYKKFIEEIGIITANKIAEVRGAIHAFARGGHPGIGQYESKYAKEMTVTLPKIQTLAQEAINTHPKNRGFKLFSR